MIILKCFSNDIQNAYGWWWSFKIWLSNVIPMETRWNNRRWKSTKINSTRAYLFCLVCEYVYKQTRTTYHSFFVALTFLLIYITFFWEKWTAWHLGRRFTENFAELLTIWNSIEYKNVCQIPVILTLSLFSRQNGESPLGDRMKSPNIRSVSYFWWQWKLSSH